MIHSVSLQLHRATTSVLLALIAFFTTLCDATDVEFILRAYVDSVAIKPGATAARLSCTFRMIFLKQRMSTGTASTFPTAQHARSIQRQQSGFDQERNHTRAEQLLQRRVIASAKRVCRATLFLSEVASEFASEIHMKLSLAIKQAVRHQRVQVRMEVEIFAECVDRHDDG
jgi:hypothetical protein